MTKWCTAVALAAALTSVAGHAAQDEPPRFRSKVDLLTIDVAAVDQKGKAVEGLKAGDFAIKVDGKPRPVVSVELIKVDETSQGRVTRPADPRIAANTVPRNARRVLIAVDQTLITPGSIQPLLHTASQFIDRLRSDDYAAFIAYPEPGPRVDFTTDKAAVRKAVESIVGQQQLMPFGDFNIGISEAITITTGAESIINSTQTPTNGNAAAYIGPAMRAVLERGCQGMTLDELLDGGPLEECKRLVYQESLRIASFARIDAEASLRALEQLLAELGPLEGPKTMVLFSGGLLNDRPTLLDEVARRAAAARTTINVISVDYAREQDQRAMLGGAPPMALADRSLELAGLELVADRTGGTLYRGVSAGTGIFQKIESEMTAWYLVAVERQPGDPEEQKVEVQIKRRGVNVRSNRTVVAEAAKPSQSMDQLLSAALSSPFAMPGVPLRIATYAQRDTESDKYRVRIAAEIGQAGEPAGEFGFGYVLTNEQGRPQKSGGARQALSPTPGAPNQPLLFETSVTTDPGVHLLRFGVIDGEGRRGTVVHRLDLPDIEKDKVAASDLIIGNMPGEGETLHAGVEPRVTTPELAGYLELYVPERDRNRITASLEIAEGEASPALASEPLILQDADNPARRVATGFLGASMSPGRYVARATVRRDGDVVQTLTRPFYLVGNPTAVSKVAPRVRAVALPVELQRRTASYVAGFVGSLGNIVAQEDFELTKPDRHVTSELLLVRYPGTQRDLIPYRDVAEINGAVRPNRSERLVDLFLKPTDAIRERARQIMGAADEHVPSMFNPMFVIGFLQSDFQSRFELTMSDAGPDWPAGVKAVNFIETGRPTLLRTGPLGDQDVPTRGTAWIEESTGRILQTELQIGRARQAPTMVTKFRLDDRLQIIVPESMRTKNPDGAAVYSNFRRFTVGTNEVVPDPPPAAPR